MWSWADDMRYGARILRRWPGVTLIAVVTLALGIGANTAIFSVVRSVLLRPLPYPSPERLVVLNEQDLEGPMSVSWMNFLDWRAQSRSFEALAAYRGQALNLTGVDQPRRVRAGRVSASWFPALGANPALGRFFGAEEDAPGSACTVVLAHHFWTDQFGADPGVIEKTLSLDGATCAVIGVAASDLRFFRTRLDLYMPVGLMGSSPGWLERGNHQGLRVLARLKDGVSEPQARAEMETIARGLQAEYPRTNSGVSVALTPLLESQVGDTRPTLLMLLGAVGLVLMITCANVANLMLARGPSRERELAVRAALGAGRPRLVRQLLTESLLLAGLGGGLGLMLAFWALDPLVSFAGGSIPRLDQTRIDLGVLGYTLGISLLTAVLFGLVPALRVSRPGLSGALKEGSRWGTAGPGGRRLQGLLLVGEVALALVVVIGAGLMVRSILEVRRVEPGLDPNGVLALDVVLPEAKYAEPGQRLAFFQRALEGASALPGAESAAGVLCLPLAGECWNSVYVVEGLPVPAQAELPGSGFNLVTPEYFHTMRIPLLQGRMFTEADGVDKPPVIIVNESMARRHWPGGSPLGMKIKQGFPQDKAPYREIVGVVADTRLNSLEQDRQPEVFLPFAQAPDSSLSLVVRTPGDPALLAEPMRAAVLRVDPDQPVDNVRPMTEYMADSFANRRFSTLLLAIFAALALLLASVGTYGVLSCGVSQRTQEIGIRMALGARKGDVLRLVLRGGMALTAAGLVLGLTAAFAVARLISGLLFRTSALDPATYAAVCALLAATALAACWLPARRAARLDPMTALRHE